MCFHCLPFSITCYTQRDVWNTQEQRKTQAQDGCMSLWVDASLSYFTHMMDVCLTLEEESGWDIHILCTVGCKSEGRAQFKGPSHTRKQWYLSKLHLLTVHHEKLVVVFPFDASLYFYLIIFHKQVLYVLLRYIYLTPTVIVVTLSIKNWKTYNIEALWLE